MRLSRTFTVLVALAAASTLAACGEDENTAATDSGEGDAVSCQYATDGQASDVELPPAESTGAGDVPVVISTSVGDLSATLDAEGAPCTVNSFVSLAEQGYFDGTTCHRLTTEGIFVLQCGDPTASGMGGPGYRFADELSGDETYPAGTLAMANSGPDTNGSQFFIVYADTELPPSYTVFGTVDDAAVKAVADVAAKGVAGGGPDGAPATPVDIDSVTVG